MATLKQIRQKLVERIKHAKSFRFSIGEPEREIENIGDTGFTFKVDGVKVGTFIEYYDLDLSTAIFYGVSRITLEDLDPSTVSIN